MAQPERPESYLPSPLILVRWKPRIGDFQKSTQCRNSVVQGQLHRRHYLYDLFSFPFPSTLPLPFFPSLSLSLSFFFWRAGEGARGGAVKVRGEDVKMPEGQGANSSLPVGMGLCH